MGDPIGVNPGKSNQIGVIEALGMPTMGKLRFAPGGRVELICGRRSAPGSPVHQPPLFPSASSALRPRRRDPLEVDLRGRADGAEVSVVCSSSRVGATRLFPGQATSTYPVRLGGIRMSKNQGEPGKVSHKGAKAQRGVQGVGRRSSIEAGPWVIQGN